VTVELPTGTVQRPFVPKNALVHADEEPTVFAIVDRRVEQRAVHIGTRLDDGVAVSEGLQKGDHIVINPAPDLKDGSPVEVR
jgi:multidrug efflux pump subunit AcrA (membrane-fusion protein)